MRRWKTWGFRIIVIILAVGVIGVIVGLPWRIHELGNAVGVVPKTEEHPCIPFKETMTDLGDNTMYVCGANAKWEVDQMAIKDRAKRRQHSDELYWSLRTRVLTDKEMAEVRSLGVTLLMPDGVTLSFGEIQRGFNDALFHQYQMKLMAEQHKGAPKKENASSFTPVPLPLDKEWDFNVMGPTANITFTPGSVEPYEVYPVEAQDCRIPEGAVGPLDPCVHIRLWLKKGMSTLPNGILTMSGVPCVGSLCNKMPSYMELPHGGHVDLGKERIR